MKLFILYNVRDTQPQMYNDGNGMIAVMLLVTSNELEALRFKDEHKCSMTNYELDISLNLAEVKEFIEKVQNKRMGQHMVFNAYASVISDLIEHTDPCTGELYK